MNRLFYLIGFLACINNLQAQVQLKPVLKLHSEKPDSIKVDTLRLWNYQFDDSRKSKPTDSVQLLGNLTFSRIKPVADSGYFKVYNQYWQPHIAFNVYKVTDSAYIKKASLRTMILSSCVPPEVGGDYFIIGKYIFANFNVCLNCAVTGKDYCRPLVNFVIGKIDVKKSETLDEIFNQFVISPIKNRNSRDAKY